MKPLRSKISRFGAAILALSSIAAPSLTVPSTSFAQGAGVEVYNAMPPGVDPFRPDVTGDATLFATQEFPGRRP